jgi:hypothetical protein
MNAQLRIFGIPRNVPLNNEPKIREAIAEAVEKGISLPSGDRLRIDEEHIFVGYAGTAPPHGYTISVEILLTGNCLCECNIKTLTEQLTQTVKELFTELRLNSYVRTVQCEINQPHPITKAA